MKPDELKARLWETVDDYFYDRQTHPKYLLVGYDIFNELHQYALLTPTTFVDCRVNKFIWSFNGMPVKAAKKRLNYVEAMPRRERKPRAIHVWRREYKSFFTDPSICVSPKSMFRNVSFV